MKPLHRSTKSGHVGAAEGKNSGGGGYTGTQAIRESSAVGPAGLWSQPRPRFMQTHLFVSLIWGGDLESSPSLRGCMGYSRSSSWH